MIPSNEEIDPGAWATVHSDTSRPFRQPDSGQVAVRVVNHIADEVTMVFRT